MAESPHRNNRSVHKRHSEPFWWALFGAGGALSALCLPVLILLLGLAIPFGWIREPDYNELLTLVKHPLTRLFLFGVMSLSLFHWAHRFRFTLHEGLQLRHLDKPIAFLCYGSAIVGTLVAGYTLWNI